MPRLQRRLHDVQDRGVRQRRIRVHEGRPQGHPMRGKRVCLMTFYTFLATESSSLLAVFDPYSDRNHCDGALGSKISTRIVSRRSAATGNAWKTRTTNFGNAGDQNDSLAVACMRNLYVYYICMDEASISNMHIGYEESHSRHPTGRDSCTFTTQPNLCYPPTRRTHP